MPVKLLEEIVQEKKTSVIISDSVLKREVSKDIEKKERIEVKAFPGATTNCLKHHVQPSISEKHDRFVIHCGTNNLNSEDTSKKIANDIIQGWKVVKMEKSNVVISGIWPRRDRFNQLLAGKCGENNFDCIPHHNIDTRLHLNRDGLHINRKGTYQISCNFKDYFNNG